MYRHVFNFFFRINNLFCRQKRFNLPLNNYCELIQCLHFHHYSQLQYKKKHGVDFW